MSIFANGYRGIMAAVCDSAIEAVEAAAEAYIESRRHKCAKYCSSRHCVIAFDGKYCPNISKCAGGIFTMVMMIATSKSHWIVLCYINLILSIFLSYFVVELAGEGVGAWRIRQMPQYIKNNEMWNRIVCEWDDITFMAR